jgi:hypothetical protein
MAAISEWHGWHAGRRGLGSNLYRLGVPDMVIQRILRHANMSTTARYYIKTAAGDVKSGNGEAGKWHRCGAGSRDGLNGHLSDTKRESHHRIHCRELS